MQKLDVIVAATGAVVLVVAIAGAALYGGSAATETFQIVYSTKDVELDAQSGAAAGQGYTASFNVTDRNITSVTITVTFTGGNPARLAAVPVVVQVTSPDNVTQDAQGTIAQTGTSVVVTLEVNVTKAPSNHAYEASSVEAAEAHARTLGRTNGTGEWIVVARASPSVPPNEAINAEVAFALKVFGAAVQRDTPTIR